MIINKLCWRIGIQRNVLNYKQLRKCSTVTEPKTVILEKDTNITLIGINREESRNSIDTSTAKQLTTALETFEADTSSPVAVLYGVGGSFCAGHDIRELETRLEQKNFDFLFSKEGSIGPTRRHLQKPVVCAINGYCVGSGFELALLCDFRVMEKTAIMGFFNRYCGVPIMNGGTARLASLIGYSRALDVIMTGRRITGAEALEFGLTDRLVATGTSLGQAVNLAFSIAKFPMASLIHDRNSVYTNVYKESKGFRASVRNEVMNMSKEIIEEMKEGAIRFQESEKKGVRTDSWNIKEKPVPDWERKEIEMEQFINKNKTHSN